MELFPSISSIHQFESDPLSGAQVDTYGSFPFVLLKVADRSGVNKLLVRGKNYNSEVVLQQARSSDSPSSVQR